MLKGGRSAEIITLNKFRPFKEAVSKYKVLICNGINNKERIIVPRICIRVIKHEYKLRIILFVSTEISVKLVSCYYFNKLT